MSRKITTEEFIKRAVAKHGDKYNYSKSIYVNNSTNLEIYCKVCDNTFFQTPSNHNRKSRCGGCPYCSGKIKTTESLIKQAKKIHGDKYDYSKIVYVGVHDKIIVGCKDHGWFKVTPSNFTHKGVARGCHRCAKTLNKEDFINKSNKIHNFKYNYDKVIFKSVNKKVVITCPIHGDFLQLPNSHMNNRGCNECGKEKAAASRRSNTEEFTKKANITHKNKYDYSKVNYINNSTKVIIICPKHGEFEQTPSDHLMKYGCKKCSYEHLSIKYRDSIEEFIRKAKLAHGDNYDYSLVEYVNNSTKVKIICKKHGIFEQVPYSHTFFKCGCSLCSHPLVHKRGLTPYKTFNKRLTQIGVECRKNPNDDEVLQARCFKCNNFFSPSYNASSLKIEASESLNKGSANLYCRSECSSSCIIFRHSYNRIDPRSKLYKPKTEQEKARKCQTNDLKLLQCDEKRYNYCEKCGDIIDVELHHTLEIAKYGKESINSAGHILLCAGCHIETHMDCS